MIQFRVGDQVLGDTSVLEGVAVDATGTVTEVLCSDAEPLAQTTYRVHWSNGAETVSSRDYLMRIETD